MPIELQKLDNRIQFKVAGETLQKLVEWAYSIDEMVFNEQLETGSFRGLWEVDDDWLMVMKKVKERGGIAPYYGAGGSRGACVYIFKPTLSGCSIVIEHSVVNEAMELGEAEVASAQPITSDDEFTFKIMGKEYQKLRKWKNWREEQAFTSRYVYRFGQVSLGATGFTVKVEDTEGGKIIDVTDYDDW
jgi:hypothetical protein